MSGINFLADTNAFIYLMDGKFEYPELLDGNWAVSYITEIELLSKKNLVDKDGLVIKEMFKNCFRISHNQYISPLLGVVHYGCPCWSYDQQATFF